MTSVAAVDEIAETLWEAWSTKKSIPPVTSLHPDLTIDTAYEISKINFERRLKERNTQLIGKKIGLTSKAIQAWLNVDQPDFGYLSADMQVQEAAPVPATELLQPRIEAEVAFILNKNLTGPGIGIKEVLAATEYITPALEIIDCRIQDWKIKIQDTVADNAASAFFVLGKSKHPVSNLNLPLLGMKMKKNGTIASTGAGAACLGHPAAAVAWLANTMGKFGVSLNAGEVILSGALGPVTDISAGDKISAHIRSLGQVSCFFE